MSIQGSIAGSNVPQVGAETELRWNAAAAAVLRNPVTLVCAIVIVILALIAIFAPQLAPYDPIKQSILEASKQPSAEHLLGTDQFGRDVLSRIIYGTRTSLLLGLASPAVAAVVGVLLGITAGYFRGTVDRVISRFADIMLAFPVLLVGIMVTAALGAGFWKMIAALGFAFAPSFVRVARAATLSVSKEPFVEAAVASGVSHPRIIWRHILPNITAPILVLLTMWIATAIRLEATLSFLGLGTQPPQSSWGNIIRDGFANIFASSWPIVSAGAAITITALAFNLIGDKVRDALDPETRS